MQQKYDTKLHFPRFLKLRNEEGNPRQRTGCTLGRLEPGGEVDTLIAALQHARGITPAPSAIDGLRVTDSRHAGDIWALLNFGTNSVLCSI
jgi:hypothetical protein